MASKTQRLKPYTDAAIIEAIENAGGMVHIAARGLGCAPTTIYDRIKTSPAVAQAVEDCRAEALDQAESALKAAVRKGEAWAVCFTLKTLGKQRGYIERQEVTGANGGAQEVRVVFAYDDAAPGVPDAE